ncbi:methyltransferase domain-containing protein [Stutzerimonas chloritidismutans]|uniref:methyltransferase domain-containing protein n=1 Tax=Stutzerimonas chloritidismutans TaxID=203192 RepID=UPI003F158FD4
MSFDKELYQSSDVWAQPMQKGQRNLLRALLDFWPDDVKSVLDVGCGDGKLTRVIAAQKKTAKFVGLDGSSEALSRMPLDSVLGEATELPFADDSFDLVMSTDALEHIPDGEELTAWRELFRVASNCVMVAVPFKEELLDATTRCSDCNSFYHVNWHQRSYDLPTLENRAAEGWSMAGAVLSGEPWSGMLPPETAFRRTVLEEWSGWDLATCPHCGARGAEAAAPSILSRPLSSALGTAIYEVLKSQRFMRSHSEVLVVYFKDRKQLAAPVSEVSRADFPAPELRFDVSSASPELLPYPQVARYALTEGAKYRLQFPVYAEAQELHIKRTGQSEEEIYLQLEDAQGLVFEGCALGRGIEQATLKFERPLSPTYYGVLGTCSPEAPISSICLGTGPAISRLTPIQDVGYYHVTLSKFPLFVQVVGDDWIDPETLLGPAAFSGGQVNQAKHVVQALSEKIEDLESHIRTLATAAVADDLSSESVAFAEEEDFSSDLNKTRVLMLCHDQHLDRRVVAQAKTLVEEGYAVQLLALSFTNETLTEQLPEGIAVTRIGLANIVPENRIYLAYFARQGLLNKALNFTTYHLPVGYKLYALGFKLASKLNQLWYRAALLGKYRNRGLHDPLPFRKAFIEAGVKYPSDLVQVHDLPALEAGVELASTWGVPLVYDAHELYPEQKSFSSSQRKICSEAEGRLIKHADLVFAVNESIGDEMARRYDIAKPVTLLNAIDPPPEFDPDASYDLLREKLSLPKERRILLFQGGFAPHRNLEALVEAMTNVTVADVDLVMMGFGPFGDLLKEKAAGLKLLGRRVYFLPAVPQSELLQHSASADMGVIPYPHVDLNSYYCTPNKLFEFIQAGLPMLANDSPELNRFVRDNQFGYSAPMNSSKMIAKAIDDAFSANSFSVWRSNIKSKRSELAWKGQAIVYGGQINRMLERYNYVVKDVK